MTDECISNNDAKSLGSGIITKNTAGILVGEVRSTLTGEWVKGGAEPPVSKGWIYGNSSHGNDDQNVASWQQR
jgi:hypothetical protein